MKKILGIILALVLLVGCGQANTTETKQETTTETNQETTAETVTETSTEQNTSQTVDLKIGVVGTDSKLWKHIAEVVKDKGVNLEIVYFDSYPLPNAALNSGQIQLNAFQHKAYLSKEIEESGYEISIVGDTVFAPLGIYSKQLTNVADVAEGSKIAIPDDPSNGGRALILLESAGLIEVNDAAKLLPTVKDITSNPKNLEIVELSAANIPPVLDELPLAIINSGIAVDSGLQPTKDAIFLESADSYGEIENPYVNIIAVRTQDKDAAWVKTILDAYYTKEVRDIIIEDSKGASIPVFEVSE